MDTNPDYSAKTPHGFSIFSMFCMEPMVGSPCALHSITRHCRSTGPISLIDYLWNCNPDTCCIRNLELQLACWNRYIACGGTTCWEFVWNKNLLSSSVIECRELANGQKSRLTLTLESSWEIHALYAPSLFSDRFLRNSVILCATLLYL